jgi:hypothetical protein
MNFVISILQNYREKILSIKCGNCKKPIDGAYVSLENNSFHKHCFLCVVCKTSPKFYVVNQGSIYCKSCHNNTFGEKCSRCLSTFGENEEIITVDVCKYHHSCFTCKSCNIKLPLTGFGFRNKEIFCNRC